MLNMAECGRPWIEWLSGVSSIPWVGLPPTPGFRFRSCPVASAHPSVTPAVGLPVLGWGGTPRSQTGSVPVTRGWFGAGLLCGLGQVAFPLWDSVSSGRGVNVLWCPPPTGDGGVCCSPERHQQHLLCPLLSSCFREAPCRRVDHSCGIFNFLMEKRWTEKKTLSSPEHSTVACHSSAPSPWGPHLPQSLTSHSNSCFDA